MGQVLQFPSRNVFYPETIKIMGAAYDSAIAGLPADSESEFLIRELIAKRIIKMARCGEDDRERLCKSALSGFGRQRYRAS
jgi:hypothetical protein